MTYDSAAVIEYRLRGFEARTVIPNRTGRDARVD
jgi:hypothetical protein